MPGRGRNRHLRLLRQLSRLSMRRLKNPNHRGLQACAPSQARRTGRVVDHRRLLRLRWRTALEPAHGSKATPDAPHVPLQPSHTAAPTQRRRTRGHGAAQHGPPQPSDWAAPDLKKNRLSCDGTRACTHLMALRMCSRSSASSASDILLRRSYQDKPAARDGLAQKTRRAARPAGGDGAYSLSNFVS